MGMYEDEGMEDTATWENAGRIAPKHDAYAELEMIGEGQEPVPTHEGRIVETVVPERVCHVPVDTPTGTETRTVTLDEHVRYSVRCLSCARVFPIDTILLESAVKILHEWDCPNKEEKQCN